MTAAGQGIGGIPGPDRFAAIVGAPRCGTTALSEFLKGHPDVCFSIPKEPHYFTLHDFSEIGDEELGHAICADYLPRYFGHCLGEADLVAEGSVSYLYSPETTAQLLRIWPKARFIIAVRDPMEMIPSLHQRSLYQGDETVTDFARAWALTSVRARGERIPRSCYDPRLLRYDEVGKLYKYIRAFFDRVGHQRCHVVVYDDILNRPAEVIAEILSFLGLSHDGSHTLERAREARGFRFGWLQRFLKRPPGARNILAGWHYRQRLRNLEKKTPAYQQALIDAVIRVHKQLLILNRKPAPPINLPAELRQEIHDYFREDTEQLANLLGRDLGHWLSVDTTG